MWMGSKSTQPQNRPGTLLSGVVANSNQTRLLPYLLGYCLGAQSHSGHTSEPGAGRGLGSTSTSLLPRGPGTVWGPSAQGWAETNQGLGTVPCRWGRSRVPSCAGYSGQ